MAFLFSITKLVRLISDRLAEDCIDQLMGDNEPERGTIIPFLFENGDNQQHIVTDISLDFPDCLLFGDNDQRYDVIISIKHSSNQRKQEKKRYLLQMKVDYHLFSKP